MSENTMSLAQPEAPTVAYVYFASCISGGKRLVKIGKARDPKKRLELLKIGCPFPMKLDYYLQYDSDEEALEREADLHEALKNHRINGEWFSVDSGFVEQLDEFLRIDNFRRAFLNAYAGLMS